MVVQHHVWFQFKEGTPAEKIAELHDALMALKDKIPEIKHISFGRNFTTRAGSFTHGLTVVLDSAEDLPKYADHPAHQEVLKSFILPIKENVMALDYVEGAL